MRKRPMRKKMNSHKNAQKPQKGSQIFCAFCAFLWLFSLAVGATQRPPVIGRNAAVSAGHPLTSAAAFEILTKGGNAFDAGVAAPLVGGVVEQDPYSLGREALVLVCAN